MDQNDLNGMLKAIKSENWGYVVNWLPTWSHSSQFLFLDNLPIETLEKVHFHLFNRQKFLEKRASEAGYSCTTTVTLLRKKNSYPDIKSDDDYIVDQIVETIDEILTPGVTGKITCRRNND